MIQPSTALLVLLGAGVAGSALAQAPPAAPGSPAVAECLRRQANPPDISDEEAFRRGLRRWIDVCREAVRSDDADPRLKVSLAGALGAEGQRAEAVALLRAAASRGDAEALMALFEEYKSFGRRLDRPRLVQRDEAERSLRAAAERGHPEAMHVLAVLLDRGSIVRRDPAGARLWAERAAAQPPRSSSRADVQVLLGRLLVRSEHPEERARGRDLLEALARAGRADARTSLAGAMREDDPARARTLLEEALRGDPGGAIPPLADMLIRGEGGPAEPRRALQLLRTPSDAPGIRAALGRLHLEGRLVPRDIREGVRLIRAWAVWDYDTRLQLARLLAENPDIRIDHPDSLLYDMVEAAELGEPGARAALIDLKLSGNAPFRDQGGGCALVADASRAEASRPARWAELCRTR